jgi:hypothetical protein
VIWKFWIQFIPTYLGGDGKGKRWEGMGVMGGVGERVGEKFEERGRWLNRD